jgi:hypothetical protein
MVLVGLVVLGLLGACRRQVLEFERQGFEQKMAARLEEAMARPAVDKAFAAFVEDLTGEPALLVAGTSLFEALAADPKVGTAVGEIMESLQTLPAMQQAVTELMARDPSMSSDQVGEMIGDQVSSALDSQQANAVFEELGKAVMESRELAPLKRALGARIERAITREDEERWSKRIIELNGGSRPDPARATELYLEHAWSAERIEKMFVMLLQNGTARREIAKLLAAALVEEQVVAQLRGSTAVLVQDPAFRARAMELVSASLASPRDDKAVAAALRGVVLSTQTLDGLNKAIGSMTRSSEIARRADAMLAAIRADPEVRAAVDGLLNRW